MVNLFHIWDNGSKFDLLKKRMVIKGNSEVLYPVALRVDREIYYVASCATIQHEVLDGHR